jgi:hypothetical protein
MTRLLFSVWKVLSSWCGAPTLTRGRVCNLHVQLLLGLARAVTLGSKSRRSQTIFYCLIWDSPNLEGQVPVFISPRNRVAQLYPRALGFLFIASYDSQGYGGGILTRLHIILHVGPLHRNSTRTAQKTQLTILPLRFFVYLLLQKHVYCEFASIFSFILTEFFRLSNVIS